MSKIDFRTEARAHLAAAKNLLQLPGESQARYACLELRMTIEAMAYELFQDYQDQLPRSAMIKWPPKQVMEEITAIDPDAQRSRTIRMGKQPAKSVAATQMILKGEDRRFTAKWANKAHNGLGSFLHSPTLDQRQKGLDQSEMAARKKCTEIIAEMDDMVNRPYFRFHNDQFIHVNCDCGVVFKRRQRILSSGSTVECIGCGALYEYEPDGEKAASIFRLQQVTWDCPGCGVQQGIGVHKLGSLPTIVCDCGEQVQVEQRYAICQIVADGQDVPHVK